MRFASIRAFYSRWLSPEGALGLHLVVGFVVALVMGLVFNAIRDEVFEAPATIAVDVWAERVAASLRTPGVTAVMHIVTRIGNSSTLTVLTVLVAAYLYHRGSHRRLFMFLATMIGGSILDVLLKLHFQRARPTEIPSLVVASGYSFPSGHSMGSMLFFGSLAYVLAFSIEGKRWLRALAIAACGVLVVLVGGSRIYLGVHYLSDVVAGFAAGLFWLGVCLTGTESWVRLRDWRRAQAGASADLDDPPTPAAS